MCIVVEWDSAWLEEVVLVVVFVVVLMILVVVIPEVVVKDLPPAIFLYMSMVYNQLGAIGG